MLPNGVDETEIAEVRAEIKAAAAAAAEAEAAEAAMMMRMMVRRRRSEPHGRPRRLKMLRGLRS